ncbi:MAG: hypothetical protein ACR2HJ_03795 [Fimbriimonadales bacterium]
MRDLNGHETAASVTVTTSGESFHGGGQFFEGNTGDHALLLNDGTAVGTIIEGGGLTYAFDDVGPGTYNVFTLP